MYILASAMNNYLQLFCPTKCQLRKILIARSDAPEICSARFCQFFNGSLLFFLFFFVFCNFILANKANEFWLHVGDADAVGDLHTPLEHIYLYICSISNGEPEQSLVYL